MGRGDSECLVWGSLTRTKNLLVVKFVHSKAHSEYGEVYDKMRVIHSLIRVDRSERFTGSCNHVIVSFCKLYVYP